MYSTFASSEQWLSSSSAPTHSVTHPSTTIMARSSLITTHESTAHKERREKTTPCGAWIKGGAVRSGPKTVRAHTASWPPYQYTPGNTSVTCHCDTWQPSGLAPCSSTLPTIHPCSPFTASIRVRGAPTSTHCEALGPVPNREGKGGCEDHVVVGIKRKSGGPLHTAQGP